MSEYIRNKMNELGKNAIPFIFILDFDMKKPFIIPLSELDSTKCLFSVNGKSNVTPQFTIRKLLHFKSYPPSYDFYSDSFNLVQKHIGHGDSFLLNLTMPSKVETNLNLKDIFYLADAKYKLWYDNEFVVFSPEIFVKTKNNKIHSYPMKGTIDANVEDAEQKLLTSEKELAEHYTIVDLIRNDLSMVSKNVRVEQFRYIDKLVTHNGALLQMSSEIVGDLNENFQTSIGDIIVTMLPAGSISGAPKKKTIEIIKDAEKYDRGYYTGVFGIFDGENIDSGVMIRYIENSDDGLIYKSGGGITAMSYINEEYKELVDKVYIPVSKGSH